MNQQKALRETCNSFTKYSPAKEISKGNKRKVKVNVKDSVL